MASADFCTSIPTPLDVGSTEVALGTYADLPGYDAPTFTLMPVGSTLQRSVQVLGFDDISRLTPLQRLISASCSSGQRFAFGFLQIRSHPRHPCRSANSSPCRASRGLSPPSKCALPGALKQKSRNNPAFCLRQEYYLFLFASVFNCFNISRTIHQFDQRHRSIVALTESKLQDT